MKQTIEENEGLPQLANEQGGSSDQKHLYQTITFSSFPDGKEGLRESKKATKKKNIEASYKITCQYIMAQGPLIIERTSGTKAFAFSKDFKCTSVSLS